jgi:hypothetical protein
LTLTVPPTVIVIVVIVVMVTGADVSGRWIVAMTRRPLAIDDAVAPLVVVRRRRRSASIPARRVFHQV